MSRGRDGFLPSLIATSDPGSFAMRTIVERKPRIVAQVLRENDLGREERNALDGLLREMREGTVTNPFAGPWISAGALLPAERAAWEGEVSRQVGRTWLDIPWYFAEAFFYLKVLAACGYFADPAPGPDARRDPFATLKARELTGPHGGQGVGADDPLRVLLMASLWGNRVDLSNFQIDEGSRRGMLAHDSLIVDHTDRALDALRSAGSVHFVLDNAGPELVSDLLLTAALMESGTIVTLYAKRMPFFVSDATSRDVLGTIDSLGSESDRAVAAVGWTLRSRLDDGRLKVRDHWFWTGPLQFPCIPADLLSELREAGLVIVKGDANYRRLLEDRRWETWRSMDRLVRDFPRPFLCLRTMKSEIVVDVPRETAARLGAEDPEWLFNGKRGIVRFCGKKDRQMA